MDLSNVRSLDDIIQGIKNAPFGDDAKNRAIIHLRGRDYNVIKPMLIKMGVPGSTIDKIYKYPSGRFRWDNTVSSVKLPNGNLLPVRAFNYTKKYSVVSLDIPSGIYEDLIGIIIPVFGNNTFLTYESDSEFYLAGNKIVIVDSISSGVDTYSNHRIQITETNNPERLIKVLNQNGITVDFIFDKSSQLVFPVSISGNLRLLRGDPEILRIKQAMRRLDKIKQPYPKDFLLDSDGKPNPLLISLINNPDKLQLANQILTNTWASGDPTMYSRFGLKDVELSPRYIFGKSMLPPRRTNNRIQIIPLAIADTDRHQMLLIFDHLNSIGLIFDPAGHSHPNIMATIKAVMPTYTIKESILCPFQQGGDKYCVGWSYYVSVVFLLNNTKFDDVVSWLLNIDPIVQIARFLISLDQEAIEGLFLV